MVKWEVLKSYLTQECKRYNANEYNHWKLNIYTDHIKISGNNREITRQGFGISTLKCKEKP